MDQNEQQQSGKLIFISAAETSGDIHAANLIKAALKLDSSLRFVGIGGPRMADAGCELLVDMVSKASMLGDAFKRIPEALGVLKMIYRWMRENKPDLFVPVDSPGFNWHACRRARRCGIRIMHYVAPQLWAWAPWRIRKLRKLTDHVACLLPFEQEYFSSRGVDATFVGNPVLDHVAKRGSEYPAPPADGEWKIALLPGSRSGEIRDHAAAMVTAAGQIREKFPQAEFTFAAVDDKGAAKIAEIAGESIEIRSGCTAEILQNSHAALAASGTVTLEIARLGVPFVVFYKVSRVSYNLLGRWLLQIPNLSLVNIVAGREIVPELMPWYGDASQLSQAMCDLLGDADSLADRSRELIKLSDTLVPENALGASENTAALMLEMLNK